MQPSISSSCKNTELDERVGSDRGSLTSPSPDDGKIDDTEQGQQPLAKPSIETVADISPNFDLSFLAEFDQQIGNQDGDDIFNLNLSSSPSFSSSIVPNTYSESIPPAAGRTPENLSSLSLRSGDETPFSTRQPQSSSFLETNSNAPPTTLHGSTLASTSFASQNPFEQSCRCLAAVVFAVEEFEASCKSGNRAELDSIVAHQKEAVKCCRSMFKCGHCTAKRENLVFLVFMAEKIAAACGSIVGLYRLKGGNIRAGSRLSSLLSCFTTNHLSHRVNAEDRGLATPVSSPSSRIDCTRCGSITSARTETSSDWQELLVGDYEISSSLEWEHLIRVLIFLQLRAVMELLVDIKNVGSKVLGETQITSLAKAGLMIGELERDIYI